MTRSRCTRVKRISFTGMQGSAVCYQIRITQSGIQSPCGTAAPTLFELTYRRVWRPELSDEGQWCDFLVEQKEVEDF
jgi:hypothetical protein